MKLSTRSFFVHNSSMKNRAENDVLARHVFAVLTRKRWAKKKVSKKLTHILYKTTVCNNFMCIPWGHVCK